MRRRVLVARSDNAGDVLLSGPAVRAVAASADVVYLAGPSGTDAARLLPGVSEVLTFPCPWIEADPPQAERAAMLAVVSEVARQRVDAAVILTSFHQSPLPAALLLRMAGVGEIGAISVDYPGSLLDVRHAVDDDCHEVVRALSLVEAMGFSLPEDDDARLAVRLADEEQPPDYLDAAMNTRAVTSGFVVLHPGASVPARTWSLAKYVALARALAEAGWVVVATGARGERTATEAIADSARDAAGKHAARDLGGLTDLAALGRVLRAATVVVTGNTGPAHLAAAVGTPVASLYAPTVPASRWRPWGVPHELLGWQDIPCAGCRARVCPVAGHPCLDSLPVSDVVAAVSRLAHRPEPPAEITLPSRLENVG